MLEDSAGIDGLVMKLEPEMLGPIIIDWQPEDTVLTVLPGDWVDFIVHARNQMGEEMDYLWIADGDTMMVEDTASVHFQGIGEHWVECQVSDRNFTTAVHWRVTADDFFIRSASPDTSELVCRRNSIAPFSLDVVCIDEDAWTTRWILIDRNLRRNPLGDGDSLSVTFDLAGECRIEALAERDGEEEIIRWNVAVRSAVWWWNPHADTISVYHDAAQDFNVVPFNQDSDSLGFEWWWDGVSLEWDQAAFIVDFVDEVDLGVHELIAVCRDGVEADTIGWVVNVIPREDAPWLEVGLPAVPTLYPPPRLIPLTAAPALITS